MKDISSQKSKAIRFREIKEKTIKYALLMCAFTSVLAVIIITMFIFWEGMPLFGSVNPIEFLLNPRWEPSDAVNPSYGILAFIIGSVYVTALALLLGIPIGIACAIFLAEIAKGPVAKVLRRAVEILAGIPSVVYGLFGYQTICIFVRESFGGTGYSVLSAAIVLAIMILPTIINIGEISIRAVPGEYREGSLAVGATHWQTIVRVLLPAARSGIIAGIVLGTGRAIGETMAVLMVAGNSTPIPFLVTDSTRTLTMNIVTDMSYASGLHRVALFTTSIVLFVFIMILNSVIQFLTRKSRMQGA
ncbi:MAG: phosphate ABC transporter permease subunit PstC [Spirochaetales bacterium]|nr:phosphate ABC transporter permease subunit PstC [Spirochaetales bacterium]